MTYHVRIKRSAEKDLTRLPEKLHDHIIEKILALAENPRPVGVKKLAGRGGYRIRVGDYRILYSIDDKIQSVIVIAIRHRREAYR